MEKYSQYRDKGSGIAPFFPISPAPSGIYVFGHALLFIIRVPLLAILFFSYFCFLQWLPIGSLLRKAALWLILGVPGIWWVDLQVDGVKRGTLAANSPHLPGPGDIISASSTSPLDPLYLAAIFDPIIAETYPHSRLVRPVTLVRAILHQLSPRSLLLTPTTSSATLSTKPSDSSLMTLAQLAAAHPGRIVLVMPESTTTNGRGILPLSPALLASAPGARIFPTNLRYAPADITTPIPGWAAGVTFLWNLCSRPTHTIRVRIAGPVRNRLAGAAKASAALRARKAALATARNSYATNFLDSLEPDEVEDRVLDGALDEDEQGVLDSVAESLARLGRVKRVGLGVAEKAEFVRAWTRRRK